MTTLGLILTAALLGADPAANSDQVQTAVAKSLEFLEIEGSGWKDERKCAACHHVTWMVWAMNEARTAGYPVNEKVLSETTQWAFTEPAAKILPEPPKAEGDAEKPNPNYAGLNLGSVYAALALESVPAWDDSLRVAWNKIATHLSEKQTPEGSWALPSVGRQPLSDLPETVTTLVVLAASSARAKESGQLPDLATNRARGLEWLAKTPPGDSHQVRALRLLVAARTGAQPDDLKPLIAELTARQNAEGGWSQTADMPADAFATGQSLYALRSAGVPTEDPAVVRGVAFLIKTQTAEGNWPMQSRPTPGPEGKPSKDLGPITFAGTAWGTLGLVKSVPRK